MNKVCFIIIYLWLNLIQCAYSQDTYYYKFTKKIKDGIEYTNTAGGQFISFIKGECYDSDKYGIPVGNGKLTLEKLNNNSFKNYFGNSYFGKVVYRFKPDLSVLNIIVSNNLVYVYKRTIAPNGIETCSLIRNKGSRVNSSSSSTAIRSYNGGFNSSTSYMVSPNGSNSSRHKTKVTKKCAYCGGKGERIQHEYVSTFGQSGSRVYCSKCNQSWNYGTVHAHHRCNHCKGTGVYEYEY